MKITVILCTHNRCRSLAKALQSVALSQLPDSVEWEVLVVDNNSSDQTREVTEAYCRQYPERFRYLFEPQPGKSYALNSGIREARGEILAFMDDDVTVEPTWLQNLTSNLHDNQWAGAGGRILPEQSFSPPRWLALHGPFSMGGVLALFDRGDEPGEIDWAPYGTNMAFRRAMFEKFGGFRTDLGPIPGSQIRNEDTEFGYRVMKAGELLRWEPSAVVYHEVAQHRLHKKYFLEWWFDYGRAEIRVKIKRPDVLGIPRHYISILNRLFSILPGRTRRWLLAFDPPERFFKKCMVYWTIGEIVEIYRREYEPREKGNDFQPRTAKG
jgi:glycosyltransferase involved in cell wall biosynthesis